MFNFFLIAVGEKNFVFWANTLCLILLWEPILKIIAIGEMEIFDIPGEAEKEIKSIFPEFLCIIGW